MSESLKLDASVRNVFGKKVRQLRRSGLTPANIYVKGKTSVAISVDSKVLHRIIHEAGKTHPVQIQLDNGQVMLVLVHDYVQNFNELDYEHIVFYEIKQGEMVEAEVPIELVGESPAERLGKLLLVVNDTVEIKGEATHLPDVIEVDKSSLVDDDDNITAGQIKLPKNITLVSDHEAVIVKVEIPKAEESNETTEVSEQTAA